MVMPMSDADYANWRRLYKLYDVLPTHEAALIALWMKRIPGLVPYRDTSGWLRAIGCPSSESATWDEIAHGVGYLLLESLDARHAMRASPRLAFVAPVLFRCDIDFPHAPKGCFIEHRRVWLPQYDHWVLTITYPTPSQRRTSIAAAALAPDEWSHERVRSSYQELWCRVRARQPQAKLGAMAVAGSIPADVARPWLEEIFESNTPAGGDARESC
jgi:hypothetical protein